MTFAETLNQYMHEFDCTAKRLSELSNISMAQISRYRNGISVPDCESEAFAALSRSLAQLADEKGISAVTEETIVDSLYSSSFSAGYDFDYDALTQHLDLLISTLGIRAASLSMYCNLDASTISRIRSGQQKPRDPFWIAQSVADYVARHYFGFFDQRKVMELMNRTGDHFETVRSYSEALCAWLSGEKKEEGAEVFSLLDNMDTFDLDEFLRARSFGKVKIPTVPFHIPYTKTYTGVKGMEEGILAFLKTTALSRPSRDAVLYSDHPMDHCTPESDFPGKWMKGLAAVLLKGVHIHMIHNIDRPFREMMLGLEAWVPVYMTGLITPYCFDHTSDNIYHHLIMVSGSAAIVGDAVSGYPESGRYVFYKANAEVARCRARADRLLSTAKPLMDIYREERAEEFRQLLDRKMYIPGKLKSYLTVPPIYTIGKELLTGILERNQVSKEEAARIQAYSDMTRKRMEHFLRQGSLAEDIAICTEKEFKTYPAALSLSGMFGQADLFYTYEEYLQHIQETKKFAAEHENYTLNLERAPDFRNIQIIIRRDEFVLVSKNKSPVIHFVIRHPKMVHAMSNLMMVLTENEKKTEKDG